MKLYTNKEHQALLKVVNAVIIKKKKCSQPTLFSRVETEISS